MTHALCTVVRGGDIRNGSGSLSFAAFFMITVCVVLIECLGGLNLVLTSTFLNEFPNVQLSV